MRSMCKRFVLPILLILAFLRSTFSLLQVRLNGSVQNVKAQGRIEVFYNKTWGTVCENGLNDRVCVVVCRQLGYSGGLCVKGENDGMCVTNNKKIFSEVKDHGMPIWTGNVECTGNEENLGHCLMTNFGETNCGHHEDGGCICGAVSGGSALEESSCNQSRHRIRPLDGSNILSAGIVEVQNEIGQWGVICDDGWDDGDAFVLCSCLGYQDSRYFRAMIHSTRTTSSFQLPILYSQVDCTSMAAHAGGNLWDCDVQKSGFTCDPQSEAAAVSCTSDIFHHENVEYEVDSQCDGSLLEGCFIGLGESHAVEQFFVQPECQSTQFVWESLNRLCFQIDMLKCTPFYIQTKKGINELCYDIHYQNIRDIGNLLKHGSTWMQRICCAMMVNASVLGSFAPLRKAFKDVKIRNKNSNNITMDCFLSIFPESNDSIEFPAEVDQGSPVSCYVDLSSWNTDFLLTVPDCFFLADPQDASISFQFLQNKCITSSHLGMEFFSPSMTRWGFRFKVPMFEDKNSLFIMCKVHLCDPLKEGKPFCDRSCQPSSTIPQAIMAQKRKRRDGNTVVDGGPFIVISRNREPLIVKEGSNYVISLQDKVSAAVDSHPRNVQSFLLVKLSLILFHSRSHSTFYTYF